MDLATVQHGPDASPGILPSAEDLDRLRPGDHVRLGLESGARFWCRIVECRPSGYVGVALGDLPVVEIPMGSTCYFDKAQVFGMVAR